MTLNLTAIFGAEPALPVADMPSANPYLDAPDDPAERPTGNQAAVLPIALLPIVEGTEHFSIWIDDADGDWPEFVPGYHYDIRQPSRLRGLCSVEHDQNGRFRLTTQRSGRSAIENRQVLWNHDQADAEERRLRQEIAEAEQKLKSLNELKLAPQSIDWSKFGLS